MTWLNESVPAASFFLVKVEAIQIGDSAPAPLLTLITGPSAETRQLGAQKQEQAERHDLRERFWSGLLTGARGRRHPHSAVSASTDTWLSAGSGMSGVHFTYVLTRSDAGVQLIIERPRAEENAEILEALHAARDEIEADFGESLEWERIDGRKKCTIGASLGKGGYRDDEAAWPRDPARDAQTYDRS